MLSDDDIRAVFHSEFKNRIDTLHFARAIEAKVRQQDEALLRQCLDYLENHNPFSIGMYGRNLVHAIKARLGEA